MTKDQQLLVMPGFSEKKHEWCKIVKIQLFIALNGINESKIGNILIKKNKQFENFSTHTKNLYFSSKITQCKGFVF